MVNLCAIRRSLASALLGALLAAIAGVVAVSAADLAPPSYVKAQPPVDPANDWSGFYAGVHVGYGWGQSPTTVTPDATEALFLIAGGINYAPVPDTSRISGVLGGAQVGYNIERSGWLVGFEADLSHAGWRSSGAATGPFYMGGILNTAVSTKLDWFGTVRGRVGALVAPSLLLYGTGGLAYGAVNTSVVGSNVLLGDSCDGMHVYCASGATSGVSIGWSAGAGMEYAFAPAWSIRAEYLHVDLGDRSVTFTDSTFGAGVLTAHNSFRADTVDVGLNYRFGH